NRDRVPRAADVARRPFLFRFQRSQVPMASDHDGRNRDGRPSTRRIFHFAAAHYQRHYIDGDEVIAKHQLSTAGKSSTIKKDVGSVAHWVYRMTRYKWKERLTVSSTEQMIQVQEVLDKLRPFIQGDGGDVELVDVEDGVVKVR